VLHEATVDKSVDFGWPIFLLWHVQFPRGHAGGELGHEDFVDWRPFAEGWIEQPFARLSGPLWRESRAGSRSRYARPRAPRRPLLYTRRRWGRTAEGCASEEHSAFVRNGFSGDAEGSFARRGLTSLFPLSDSAPSESACPIRSIVAVLCFCAVNDFNDLRPRSVHLCGLLCNTCASMISMGYSQTCATCAYTNRRVECSRRT